MSLLILSAIGAVASETLEDCLFGLSPENLFMARSVCPEELLFPVSFI